MFAWLGLVLVLASWLIGGYIVVRWRDKALPTISEHAASSNAGSVLFGIMLAVMGPLVYWWLVNWASPRLGLGSLFMAVLGLTIALQILTGIFPDRPGRSGKIHHITAWAMAWLFLPSAALLAGAPRLSIFGRIIDMALIMYMITAICLLRRSGKARKWFLPLQASYIIAFQLVILVSAYFP